MGFDSLPAARWKQHLAHIRGMAGVIVAIAAYEGIRHIGIASPDYLPSLLSVLRAQAREAVDGGLLPAIAQTVQAWLLGLCLALAIGLPIGVAMGLSRWLDAAMAMNVRLLRPVPSVALIPVAILVAGLGIRMKLIPIVFASLWAILLNARYAAASLDPMLLETGRALGFRGPSLWVRVALPAAMPALFSGIRISAAVAYAVAVSVELVTGIAGLGEYIRFWHYAGRAPEMYSGLLAGALMGYAAYVTLRWLERTTVGWSPEYREREA